MNKEVPQRLAPQEVTQMAHLIRDNGILGKEGVFAARYFIHKTQLTSLGGKTIRQAVNEGKIEDAFKAVQALSEGTYI